MATIPVLVTVSNADGTTSASASIDVTSSAGGVIPMSLNDPIFANAVSSGSVTLSNGQSLTDKKIVGAFAGNPAITMLGNNSLTRISMSAREGPRIASSGFFNITSCWLETNGVGADHADTIQAYAPGSNGIFTLKNSTIRAYSSGSAGSGTGSVGVFIADGWGGKVVCDNVLFWGGQFGCRIFPDAADIRVDFNNVFFVGPFGFGKFDIRSTGGHIVVDRWNNVRDATIVNGVIVPGNLLASP